MPAAKEAKKEEEEQGGDHILQFVSESAYPQNDTFVYDGTADPPGTVEHGLTFTVDQDRYEELGANSHTATVLKEVDTDYSEKTRAELEEAASDAGVQDPDDLELYPTEGTLAIAVERANAEPTVVEVHTAEDQEHDEAEEAVEAPAEEAVPDESEQPQEEGAE